MSKVKLPKILQDYLESTDQIAHAQELGVNIYEDKAHLLNEAEWCLSQIKNESAEAYQYHPSSKKALERFVDRLRADGVVPSNLFDHPEYVPVKAPTEPSNMIDVVIIDTEAGSIFKQTIENSLSEFYKTIGCSCIDIAVRSFGGHVVDCIVDDEGLLKSGAVVSVIDTEGEPQLVGNVIFTGFDYAGNTISLTDEQANIILSMVGVAQYSDGKMRMIARCDHVE